MCMGCAYFKCFWREAPDKYTYYTHHKGIFYPQGKKLVSISERNDKNREYHSISFNLKGKIKKIKNEKQINLEFQIPTRHFQVFLFYQVVFVLLYSIILFLGS